MSFLKRLFQKKLKEIKEVPCEEMGVKIPRAKTAKTFREIQKRRERNDQLLRKYS